MSLLSEGGTELTPSLLATGTCQSLPIISSQMYRSCKWQGVTSVRNRLSCPRACWGAVQLGGERRRSADHPL